MRRFRRKHPTWGTRRLCDELRPYFPTVTRRILQRVLWEAHGRRPPPRRAPRPRQAIPVGRHRVQMDIQQLPAITGGGYMYKISVIHLRTRLKYSEFHRNHRSRTVAEVLQRAQDQLPPFRLVWTDNAYEFTLRFSAHPERRTTFQQRVMARDLVHGTCRPRSPWQNGIIERSHRTDNAECFRVVRFVDDEDRRYQHRLYEMKYNTRRPHQGLNGETPFAVYQREYPLHATTRMLGAPPVNMAR